MSDVFTVRLERVFQGPLDLLLHLVREQEVEIHEVEISRVVEGYIEYLRAMTDLDIELAGDFLVMAATLMSIKSRSLLPRDDVDLETDLDPRDELIQRLIEYRRFKEASEQLGSRFEERALQHVRGHEEEDTREVEPALDLGELTCWDLLAAFSRLMRETLANRPHRVTTDPRPLRFYVHELAHRIRERGEVTLRDLLFLLDAAPSRESLVGSFCALLELVKLGLVGVTQDRQADEIMICLKPEHAGDIEDVVDASLFDDEIAEAAASETAMSEAEATPSTA